ncbi:MULTISPECIES: hypothetical protein [Methanocorpusculum]|jgi:hypothetical protein|uniref:hypothetical protein n=1 Tax=Methanocorpusculum TaxID=2192 RepID=UPI0012DD82EB|nr:MULTISPECIES: hypothetical protein [Methanocorpusculum]MDD2248650.1 hypothetical protein [Methanocorpusculum sp.]MDD2803129.1 hypothetical protein [Methanocorpusculum sp.]MDD3047037.1 hypothetical protein [Methanocorpusculum sp.]MDD3912367.1 hypothetical protein [Methanocorpusculum sp.]MDD4423416.1 hypothetical protein [Methanocorpusculum parvum]
MTSIALNSIAKRAEGYTVIQRKNQLSKLCWFASDRCESGMMEKDQDYLIC